MIVNCDPYLAFGVRSLSHPFDGGSGSDRISGTAWPGAASAQSGGGVDRIRFGAGSWRAQRLA